MGLLEQGKPMQDATQSTITEMFRYNVWANLCVLEACQDLTADQLNASAPGTYGTIRDTLVHIIRSEAGYLALLIGERLPPPFQSEAHPSLSELRSYAQLVGDALIQAAARVSPEGVIHQEWQGTTVGY
jgi:uncharacterized damage-inducible protein DinB